MNPACPYHIRESETLNFVKVCFHSSNRHRRCRAGGGYANDEDNKCWPSYICVLVFAALLHTHIGTNWTSCPIKEKYCMIIKLIPRGDKCMNHCWRWPDDCSKYGQNVFRVCIFCNFPLCLQHDIFPGWRRRAKVSSNGASVAAANSVNIMYQT